MQGTPARRNTHIWFVGVSRHACTGSIPPHGAAPENVAGFLDQSNVSFGFVSRLPVVLEKSLLALRFPRGQSSTSSAGLLTVGTVARNRRRIEGIEPTATLS